jgi:hypothetical protein
VDWLEQNGMNELQFACLANQEDIVRCLLEAGATRTINSRNTVRELPPIVLCERRNHLSNVFFTARRNCALHRRPICGRPHCSSPSRARRGRPCGDPGTTAMHGYESVAGFPTDPTFLFL